MIKEKIQRFYQNGKGVFFVLLCLIIGIYAITVFWGFPDSPSPWFDEGIALGIAKTYVEDGVYSLKLGPNEYVRELPLLITTNFPLWGFIIASFKIFGVGLAQAKIVMILFLTIFLFLSYHLVQRLYNNKFISLASLALVVTFLPFYGNGLSGGLGEVPGLVYLFAGLLLIQKKNKFGVLLGGIFIGLCAATKIIYLPVIFAVFCNEILSAVKIKEFNWKRWLVLFFGISIPLFFWVITLIPPNASLGDLQTLYSFYHNPYQTDRSIIFVNLWKFCTETTPIHFALLFLIFIISGFIKIKNNENNNPFFYILAILITGIFLVFLETPGWYRYFFPAHLILLVLFPGEICYLFRKVANERIKIYGPIAIILFLLLAQSTLLLRERRSTLYYNPEPRSFAAQLQKELGNKADVVIIDHPELWFFMNNPNARQFMHLNPHLTIGEDIAKTKRLPDYIISNDPSADTNLVEFQMSLKDNYVLQQRDGHYFVFKKIKI